MDIEHRDDEESIGFTELEDCEGDYENCWPAGQRAWLDSWTDSDLPEVKSGTLYRVRHCLEENLSPISGEPIYDCYYDYESQLSHSMFQHWPQEGVTRDKQNDTYIATAGQMDPAQVRHLVFMAAGQQSGNPAAGQTACGQTGQDAHYKEPFRADVTMGSMPFDLEPGSLAYQVFNTNVPGTSERFRDPAETFMGLAFDHRLNYNVVSGNEDVVDAFYEWLQARADLSQLESVTFAGHSRGGNLVTKLAQRFAHDMPDIKVVVQLYEAVSEKKELYADPVTGQEAGRFTSNVHNPRVSGKKGKLVHWERAFNRPTAPSDVRVLNLTGGYCVIPGVCVRPVSGEPPAPSTTAWMMTHEGEDFYEQCWLLTDHMQTSFDFVGDDPSSSSNGARGIRHLLAACDDLGCL